MNWGIILGYTGVALAGRLAGIGSAIGVSVITSYSIHYTKLYESTCWQRHIGQGNGRAGQAY